MSFWEKRLFDFKSIGIDEVIYPETLGASEIKTLLKESAVSDSYDFDKGKLKLMGIKIDDRSDLRDKSLAETTILIPTQVLPPFQ